MKYCENTGNRNDMTQITRYKQTLQIYLHVINKSVFGNPFRYSNGKCNSSHIRRYMSQPILLNPLVMPENGQMPWLYCHNNDTTAFQHNGAQFPVRWGEFMTN
jgi:hypothetical protein